MPVLSVHNIFFTSLSFDKMKLNWQECFPYCNNKKTFEDRAVYKWRHSFSEIMPSYQQQTS